MKNVLYLSYDGMTDPLGQSQVLPYIIGLTKEGYTFTLISFEKEDRFLLEEQTIRTICKENNITWHPLPYTKRPPVLSTLKDIRKMKRLAKRLHEEQHFVLTHCRSYLSALIGLSLKQKKGVPFLFDMRGFWADERIEGGIWNKTNPIFRTIYSFFKKMERRFFSEADAVISLTHACKEELLTWNLENVTAVKITVIPCCADLELFNSELYPIERRQESRKKLGIDQSFVVGYVGSIGTWYQLEEMLIVFKRLKIERPNAQFLFVTRESARTIYKESDRLAISRNDIHVISALHHEVPLYISLFDCSVFFIRPTYSKIASSPTKQGEIMAMGIPIICNAGVGDTALVLDKYAAGQIVSSTDREILKQFKLDLSSFDAKKAMKGATEFYGLENGVASYLRVYRETGS